MREDGTGIVRTVCVGGNARANIWTAVHPELNRAAVCYLPQGGGQHRPLACPAAAGALFIAERAMYAGVGFESGYVNVATPWTGPIATPPSPVQCAYALTPTTAAVGAQGEARTVGLTTACGWTASSDVSWLVLDTAASGTGNATLQYHVFPNQSSLQASQPRTGRLTITAPGGGTAAQLTVTQAGAPATLVVDPGEEGDRAIEGIDSNHDGVRDDVERHIALSGASATEQVALADAAIAMQESLEPAPNAGNSVDRAREVLRTIDCVEALDAGSRSTELVAEVFDTYDRSGAYMDFNRNLAGEVFPIRDSANLSSCSSAVAQALPAARRAALLLRSRTAQDMTAVALEGPACPATPAARPADAAPLPARLELCWQPPGTSTTADGDVNIGPWVQFVPMGIHERGWRAAAPAVSGRPPARRAVARFAQTPTFAVAAGDKLNFYFNYITTDGYEYTEYACAGLFSGAGAGTFDSYLFMARTTTSGSTVPGFRSSLATRGRA